MGTNYYLYEKPPCEYCGREYEPKHIGKSSGGWCFGLHVVPEDGINDLEDWKLAWSADGATIKDEYGETLTAEEMLEIITDRRRFNPRGGERLTQEWLGQNHAVEGPHGLARHRIDHFCVRHGAGTWDCLIGEFS